MKSSHGSLNQYVSWQRLLDVFRIPYASAVLPAKVRCPLCEQPHLEIFQDHSGLGQWYHCDSCKSHGDLIQLAASVWNLSLTATIFRLYDHGFNIPAESRNEQGVNAYLSYYVGRQTKLKEVLTKAKDTLLKTEEMTGLVGQAGLLALAGNDKKLIATAVGAISPADVTHLLYGQKSKALDRRRHFKGIRWKSALAFPYYDLPRRLVGIQFLGRDFLPENGDAPFIHLRSGVPPFEGGLYFNESSRAANDTVFAFDNPLEAAKYQVRARSLRGKHISVTAWRFDDNTVTRGSWVIFRGRKVVHLCDTFNHRLLLQAILSDGCIYQLKKSSQSSFASLDALRIAERSARHWSAFLEAWAGNQDDAAVQELLMQLQMARLDLTQLLHRVKPMLARRITKLLSLTTDFKAVPCGTHKLLEERHDQWFLVDQKTGQEKLVADVVLQIDDVIAIEGTTFYKGVIRQHGEKLPFYVNKKLLRASPATWLENYMAVHSFGTVNISPQVERNLVQLAKQLHKPKVAIGCTKLGWNATQQLLVLSDIGLRPGGGTVPVNLVMREKTSNTLVLSDVIPGDVEAWVKPSVENHAFWAAWLAVAANILAPMAGRKRKGLAAVGEAAAGTISTIGDICGCRNITALSTSRRSEAEYLDEWPCVANTIGVWTSKELRKTLEAYPTDRNVLIRVSEGAAKILSVNGDFHVLRTSRAPEAYGYRRDMTQRLLPAFLKWVMEAPSSRFRVTTTTLAAAAEAAKGWLADQFALPGNIIDASRVQLRMASTSNRSLELLDTIAGWVVNGDVEVSTQTSRANTQLVFDRDVVVVTSQMLNHACSKLELPRLKCAAVTSQLQSDKFLVNQITLDGFEAWLVSRQALQRRLEDAGYSCPFRVVG